ncbi:MAG: dual specificity protein phosphatase [Cyanobacteria bacterium J06642_2]
MIQKVFQFVTGQGRNANDASASSQKRSKRRPFQPCWVLPERLAVGRLPREGEDVVLEEQGFNSVLSLCAPQEGEVPATIKENFRWEYFFLPDSHYKEEIKISQLDLVVKLVHDLIKNHGPLYVHCLAGQERSIVTCMAYLCTYHGLDPWGALMYIKKVRPQAAPTGSQMRVLQEFVRQLQRQKGKAIGDDVPEPQM